MSLNIALILKMDAGSSFEAPVTMCIYQSTYRPIFEGFNLYEHRCENLKFSIFPLATIYSHIVCVTLFVDKKY